jgi:hypothetical protein
MNDSVSSRHSKRSRSASGVIDLEARFQYFQPQIAGFQIARSAALHSRLE